MLSDKENAFWEKDTKNRLQQSSSDARRNGLYDLAEQIDYIAHNYPTKEKAKLIYPARKNRR